MEHLGVIARFHRIIRQHGHVHRSFFSFLFFTFLLTNEACIRESKRKLEFLALRILSIIIEWNTSKPPCLTRHYYLVDIGNATVCYLMRWFKTHVLIIARISRSTDLYFKIIKHTFSLALRSTVSMARSHFKWKNSHRIVLPQMDSCVLDTRIVCVSLCCFVYFSQIVSVTSWWDNKSDKSSWNTQRNHMRLMLIIFGWKRVANSSECECGDWCVTISKCFIIF